MELQNGVECARAINTQKRKATVSCAAASPRERRVSWSLGRICEGVEWKEMVGWHHRLNGHEFEQAPGDSEGQGSLACCSPPGHKESDMTERLNSVLRVEGTEAKDVLRKLGNR